jgi:adhesin/invasin
VTIYGQNLADGSGAASGPALPMQLKGARVRFGDKDAPLSYAAAGQLNAQIPYDIPINTQYQILVQHGDALSVPESLLVVPAQPGIFTSNQQGTGQGVIVKSDQTTLAQPGTPANAGETVVIYCTGLGTVSPPVTAGAPAPSSPAATTVNPVAVTIGGKTAQVQFAGLTPGFAGLYQVNAVVPSDAPPGDAVPVTLQVAGQISPPVTMAVQ